MTAAFWGPTLAVAAAVVGIGMWWWRSRQLDDERTLRRSLERDIRSMDEARLREFDEQRKRG